jgi:hypothetical protein
MPHSSSEKAQRARASTTRRQPRAVRGLSVPWFAVTLGAAVAAGAHALGGCSSETGTSSGFDASGSGTGTSASQGSGPGSGTGGELFNPTSSNATGSTGTGSIPLDCDDDKTSGPHTWSRSLGGAAGEYANDVAVDKGGNIFITGAFTGTVDFGGGPLTSAGDSDIFLLKLDPTGKHVWSKRYGGPDQQSSSGVAVDGAGNVYITGYYLGSVTFGGATFTKVGCCFEDVFLAKFDAQGNHTWSKGFGGVDAEGARGIAVDAAGNPVIIGQFQSSIDFGGGALTAAGSGAVDIFVAKFDTTGAHQWSKGFGDAADQTGEEVEIDAGGNVIITGQSKGTVNFGGTPLTAPSTKEAVFLAKLTGAGAHMWSKLFGDGASGAALDTNAAGEIVLAGDYRGTIDFGGNPMTSKANDNGYVARFDAAGQHIWSVTFEATSSHANGVAFDSKGKVVASGDFSGSVDLGKNPGFTSQGGFDGFVVKLDNESCHVWSRSVGDSVYQAAQGVAVDASDNVILVGNFAGVVDLGGGPYAAMMDDIFVGKFAP